MLKFIYKTNGKSIQMNCHQYVYNNKSKRDGRQ